MTDDFDLTFPATTRGLQEALEAIQTTCRGSDLDADLVSRAKIILEELFTNTVKYGYGAECERPVRLVLSVGAVLRMTYEDDAFPFDPTLWRCPKESPSPVSGRREGRAGIAMIVGLSSTVKYMPRSGGNCLVITLEPRPDVQYPQQSL